LEVNRSRVGNKIQHLIDLPPLIDVYL